jgi:hypothetical protein
VTAGFELTDQLFCHSERQREIFLHGTVHTGVQPNPGLAFTVIAAADALAL